MGVGPDTKEDVLPFQEGVGEECWQQSRAGGKGTLRAL